jgi:cell division protein FtsB
MPDKGEQEKERSKISVRIGDVQVELEGTRDDIKKLMNRELADFAKGLEGTKTQPSAAPTEPAPKPIPKTPEVAPKVEKTAPPQPPSKPSTTSEPPSQPSRVPVMGKKPVRAGKRKVSWRAVAIALVMVSIMLSAALAGVIAVYLPMADNLQSQIADKNSDIADLNSQVSSLNAQISSLQSSIDQKDSNISDLQDGIDVLNSQIAAYLNIIYLNASGSMISDQGVSQNQSDFTVVYQNTIQYLGYAAVGVQSTSNTTYVELLYSAYGINYDHNVTVGTAGTAYFPVMPSTVEIRVGNTEPYTGVLVNATVSAIYHY